MEPTEIINSLAEDREAYFGAVAPPIIQTSNFAFRTVREMREAIGGEFIKHVYSRGNNPTVEILRKKMAALEHAGDCLITSSGCTAITLAVMANLRAGDHAVCVERCYSWTRHLFTEILPGFGITADFVDGYDTMALKKAILPNTRLIYLESPTSWTFGIQDMRAVAALARKQGIITVTDNSYCTPLNQNPLDMGIDIVVHSASKYLSGHSDVVAGVLCGSEEMVARIFRSEYMTFGGIPSPFDAWLMLRGLRTLEVRLERSTSSAKQLIAFLEQHPAVERIIYPFHESHPGHSLARRQMRDGSGLFSVILRTDDPLAVERFCERLRHFLLAVSWGGHESLVLPAVGLPATHSDSGHGLPLNMVRIYAGLEDPALLRADLEQALEEIGMKYV
ncbi:MAG: PLP-dependent transferase [Bacteroidales bacterium]|nr:PLP-dependent transferase [Bacteroidales bacterium]